MNMHTAERNLEKLLSLEIGGGMFAFMAESVNGNAGHFEGYPCLHVPFLYNPKTGEILSFTNDRPRHDLLRAGFEFVVGYRPNPKSPYSYTSIVGVSYDTTKSEHEAVTTLNATLIKYNHHSRGFLRSA